LPYGRNSDRSDWRLVLGEGRGTCSAKHALLADLARENRRHVALVLGIYEMDEDDTQEIGTVLDRNGSPASRKLTATWRTKRMRGPDQGGGRDRTNTRLPARGGD
jgi:hypothetical protein